MSFTNTPNTVGRTVKFVRELPDEIGARFIVREWPDDSERCLIALVCDLQFAPTQTVLKSDVEFCDSGKPLHCPWGQIQHTTNIRNGGVLVVSTVNHGGIYVPDLMLHNIPVAQQEWAARWSGSRNWYEEDCCWAAVAVAFPDSFTAEQVDLAKRIIGHYFPESRVSE